MRTFRHIICLVFCLLGFMPEQVSAQETDETIIEFFSTEAIMEDNPKKQNYNITIFSPDGKWKVQLNYYSTSMFGTFGNEDFHLSTDGRNYNYVRNPKNDMVFYSFTDMNVKVTDEGTVYHIKADCHTNNKMRFIVEATIDAPLPEKTITDDMGYARVEENPFYETYAIYAENENYTLAYGIASKELVGTFYRADMLMPELHDKKADQDIPIIYASAVHTKEGENTRMVVDLLSEDHTLYQLTMFNGPYEMKVEREVDVNISGAILQDVTEMYGCYLFAGANAEYQVGVAIRPDSITGGKHEWTKEDLIMQFTRLYIVDKDAFVPIYDIHAVMELADKVIRLKADITSMDGTLYHITMLMEQDGYMPEPTETVNIDFGHVKVLDYSKGIGTIGLGGVLTNKYQMRAYLNTTKLEGDFTSSDFVMELCDIMVVNGDNYVFHDAKYVNANMEKQGSRTLITIDMYGIDDILYHATMYLDSLKCMAEESTYPISYEEGVTMMSVREGEAEYGEYTIQFQNLDKTFDKDDNIVGDGYYFSFYLSHQGFGVAGSYGYSAGTLAEDEYHGFYENGCEIRVAPVAGTLKIDPVKQVRVNMGPEIGIVKTYLYQTTFEFLGQNGSIYRGQGENLLLCIDVEGIIVKLNEEIIDSINESLAEQGLRVRKVLRDGKIVIEQTAKGKTYDLRGMELKKAQ